MTNNPLKSGTITKQTNPNCSIKAGAGFPVPALHLPLHISHGILSETILFAKFSV